MSTTAKRLSTSDVYAKVVASIAEALEAGVVPWEKPWVGGGAPCNAVTLRPYHGCNVFVLAWESIAKDYTSRGWVTFQQALSAGCVVRKGETGTPVFWMSEVPKPRMHDAPPLGPDEKPETYLAARLFTVFNVDQLAELEEMPGALATLRAYCDGARYTWEPIAECERIVSATGAVIRSGSAAFYDPDADTVTMPRREAFPRGASGWYPVLFHELSHWTGHASRLNRDLDSGRFGNKPYAMEELVAELSAAFLCHRVGLDHTSRASAYVASWLRALKDEPSAFVTAASHACRAADYLFPNPHESATEPGPGLLAPSETLALVAA